MVPSTQVSPWTAFLSRSPDDETNWTPVQPPSFNQSTLIAPYADGKAEQSSFPLGNSVSMPCPVEEKEVPLDEELVELGAADDTTVDEGAT